MEATRSAENRGGEMPRQGFGAVIAGGASRRFGAPKALARLRGRPLIRHVSVALVEATEAAGVVCADPAVAAAARLPARADRVPGRGPLAGLQVALEWAGELGHRGALAVACDMPNLEPALLRALIRRGLEAGQAVVPQDLDGRYHPLCAWYPVSALAAVEERLQSVEPSLQALLRSLAFVAFRPDEVARFGDPEMLFHNVNTPADLELYVHPEPVEPE